MYKQRDKVLKDRDGDGHTSMIEVAENLGEILANTTTGRWEQHLLVPAASAMTMGLFVTIALYAVFAFLEELGLILPEVARDAPWEIGLLIGGLWGTWEMYSARTKSYREQYDRGYDDGETVTEMKYQAEITRLQETLAAARMSDATAQGTTQLTDNENHFIQKGTAFLALLFSAPSRTSKDTFTKNNNVTRAMWTTIRDSMQSLGIIDEARNLLKGQSEANAIWEAHVEKIKNTRAGGGVPRL